MKKFKFTTLFLIGLALKIILSAETCNEPPSGTGGTPSSTPYSGPEDLKELTIGRFTQMPAAQGVILRNNSLNSECTTTQLYGSTSILDIMSSSTSTDCLPTRLQAYTESITGCWKGYFVAKSIDPKIVYSKTIDLKTCSINATAGIIYVRLPTTLAVNLELYLYEPCLKSACFSSESSTKRILWKFAHGNKLEIAMNEQNISSDALAPEATSLICN
jgi:hypothetical protein